MKKIILGFIVCFGISSWGQEIQSPSKNISVSFTLTSEGKPAYQVSYLNQKIVEEYYSVEANSISYIKIFNQLFNVRN